MTHDAKRNGTTSLFAAIDTTDGSVIGTCVNRRRHRGMAAASLDLMSPEARRPTKECHLICDDCPTRGTCESQGMAESTILASTSILPPTSASRLGIVGGPLLREPPMRQPLRRGPSAASQKLFMQIEEHHPPS